MSNFSIKKEGVRLVFNVFGVKFKICYKNKIDYPINHLLVKELQNNTVENRVLMLEANDFHGEVMAGYAKYLLDLDYSIDLLTTERHKDDLPLCRLNSDKIKVYYTNISTMERILSDSTIMDKYVGMFINSTFLFRKDRAIKSPSCIYKYFRNLHAPKNGFCINVCHTMNTLHKKFLSKHTCCTLANNKRNLPIVNPCSFGKVKITDKNSKTIFLISGDGSRNFKLICDNVQKLLNEGFQNFCVYITGRNKHNELEANLAEYIKFLGYVSFEKLYSIVEQADYILPCLDPNNKKHDWYLETGTTGAFQLSYGFLKPMVLSNKFADKALVNNNSALLYENNDDLYKAMQHAISINLHDYKKLQENLNKTVQVLYKTSLSNLKMLINSEVKKPINDKPPMVLFCKTYKKNLNRLKILKISIDKYNKDKIPFYIVCPKSIVTNVKQMINSEIAYYPITVLAEEEFLQDSKCSKGWLNQQIVKLRFYKANIAEFYLAIDDDSYFIKDFHISDFMYDEKTPYIVCHQGKDARLINCKFGNSDMFPKEHAIKLFFKRKGLNYRFLTSPIMFSSKVCKELDEKYNVETLIKLISCEASWHGEYLLAHNTIPFRLSEPFFKAFVYEKMYRLYSKQLNICLEDIKQNYLGVVIQNNHIKGRKYGN